MLEGTRFRSVLRECVGSLHREFKIALTPVPRGKKWVFLVGCYNSGTTLLSEILGQHFQISALITEGHFITDQFIKDYDIGVPRMWVDREELFYLNENDTSVDALRVKKEWAMRLDLSKPVLVEKSPPNTAKMRWLQKNFDDAYFIGIVRDGYAVSEGIRRKADPKHLLNSWPIEKCAYQWARSNKVLLEDSEYLENFMLITYENLTEKSIETLKSITDFIGIENFDSFQFDQELSIHERKESIRNMNSESIKNLSGSDFQKINNVAGDMLDKLEYPRRFK